ncbi:unnamed protein product [Schistosoma curassoni]|nr:unnamed protein product [Schistosoma curassoni]
MDLVFDRLQKHGITVNIQKCQIGTDSLDFLRHTIDAQGIRPLRTKVAAILHYPEPTTIKQLCTFNGLVSFYRRFIPKCTLRVKPLTDQLRGNARSTNLDDRARKASSTVEELTTMLAHQDTEALISIAVEPSDSAIEGVLQQWVNNSCQPLAFFSRRLLDTESRYSTFGRELLAIYCVVRHSQHNIEGREFTLFTDHKPLSLSLSSSSEISQFTSDIQHTSTCVDRFTRWPEAVPIKDITDETVTRAYVERWAANFGCPSTITTDRERQFESELFHRLTTHLGITRLRTTTYHPQANGMVERFHRQLKASLSAANVSQWTDGLPLVLLGIRNAVKADMGYAAAQLVY